MKRPTLAAALNSSIPRTLGLCNDRTSVVEYVNKSCFRLLTDELAPDEGWWFGWVQMLFNITPGPDRTASITTPNEIARVDVLDICNRPRFIRNGFYEYLAFGTGHRPKGCGLTNCDTTQAFERPNTPTLTPFPSSVPQGIRIYPTDARDVGRRFIVQGLDQNGNTVLGTDVTTGASNNGELNLLQMPFGNSGYQWQEITGLIKDPTNGPVTVFTVDPNTGQQTLLTSMEPNETTASYRQYLLAGLPQQCCNVPGNTVQVYAQCRLDFVAAVADTDYLIVPNLDAIEEECQSLKYSRQDSPTSVQLEAKHHQKAIRLLNGQLDLYEGKVKTAVSVPIFGSNRLRPSFL